MSATCWRHAGDMSLMSAILVNDLIFPEILWYFSRDDILATQIIMSAALFFARIKIDEYLATISAKCIPQARYLRMCRNRCQIFANFRRFITRYLRLSKYSNNNSHDRSKSHTSRPFMPFGFGQLLSDRDDCLIIL